MRAAFVTDDVLAAEPEWLPALRRLDEAGIEPVVLVTHPTAEGSAPSGAFRQIAGHPGEQAELLVDAAAQAEVSLAEAFLVCREASEALRGAYAGCRPVLVLGNRTLDDLFGPEEPPAKDMIATPDLAMGVHYMVEEAAQDRALGPFPYGPHPSLDERAPAVVPSTSDLTRIFVVVIVAGLALSLGMAYLLQEIYQTFTFPPVAYWLTLQFIPQTWRGVLFLIIGAAAAIVAQRIWPRMPRRRRAG